MSDRFQHHVLRRIGLNLIEDFNTHLCLGHGGQDAIEQADFGNPGIGDYQYTLGVTLAAQLAEAGGGAGFAENLGGGGKAERIHWASRAGISVD